MLILFIFVKAVNELLSTIGNEKSSHDQQEPGVELSCASGSSMGEEDCSLQVRPLSALFCN